MKKLVASLLAVAMVASLAGCGSNSGTNETTTSAVSSNTTAETTAQNTSDTVYKIGVCQYVQHDALDASYQGFVDGLAEAGFVDGQNIKIDYNNAAGEEANCVTIAQKLVNDDSDLILAIATPAAQAVANQTQDIPILVTAVTDPASSKLVNSNENPGTNVSGTSDLNPIEEQIALLLEFVPDAKNVAILYCSSEKNSKVQAELAITAGEAAGLTMSEVTVSNSNEIAQVVQSLAGKVDAIYAPTDNMIAAGMATVAATANENGIPVICGEAGMVENGGLATYGIDYYELGKLTAEQAVQVLNGEADIAQMPIQYLPQEKLSVTVNEEAAQQLGITIPDKYLNK